MNLFGSDKRDEYSAAIMDSSSSSSALIAVYSAFSSSGSAVQVSSCVLEGSNLSSTRNSSIFLRSFHDQLCL